MSNTEHLCVNDVCDYIIHRMYCDESSALESNTLTNLKLQKLLYYTQAYHLSNFEGQRLFDEDFEAWVHGPVCKKIYDRFKSTKSLYSTINQKDAIQKELSLSEDKKDFIDRILEVFGVYTGSQLESMTHQEEPWINARQGLGMFERGNVSISDKDMQKFYA